MTQYDRIYVRFKGRVLGPLTHEKAADLVRRGQITKQHELSPDGQAWRMAEEFTELFSPPTRGKIADAQLDVQLQPATVKPIVDVDQWYAHFDGGNQGPVNEGMMRQWVNQGKVRRDTMIWKSSMDNWLEAQFVRDGWFENRNMNAASTSNSSSDKTSANETGDLQWVAERLLKSNSWAYFSAIAGIVLGTSLTIGSIALFLFNISRASKPSTDIGGLLVCLYWIAWSVAILLAAMLLLQYSNAVSAMRFRVTANDVGGALHRLAKFWSFTGICLLVWILISLFLGFLFYTMVLSLIP
ncbi:MAG: DUF4339 domain-containing protein [Pirellulaceae bacterium]|nr:DUF4339 domain-containing protein [Pirellulaceae bacterium]